MTHANVLDLNKQLPKMYTDYPSISMGVTPTMNIIALMVHGEYSTYVIFCLKTTRVSIVEFIRTTINPTNKHKIIFVGFIVENHCYINYENNNFLNSIVFLVTTNV